MRGARTSCSSTSIPQPRRRRCPASSTARASYLPHGEGWILQGFHMFSDFADRAFLYSGKSQASNREDAEFMQLHLTPTLSHLIGGMVCF